MSWMRKAIPDLDHNSAGILPRPLMFRRSMEL